VSKGATTGARGRILGRLRSAPQRPMPGTAELPVRRFDWLAEERTARFTQALAAVRGEIIEVCADWPRRVADLLAERGAGRLAFGPEAELAAELTRGWPPDSPVRLVPWAEPIETGRDRLFGEIDAALTGCRGAVAETGSLVLWPSQAEPRLLSLVPPIHLVLLDPREIRSTFHELLVEQGWFAGMPTNALLITGPSKSADIEQTLTYGVHGPKELIVLIRTSSD
jgi:L-lactate dehydrogenase complex protein LldG